MSTKTFDFEGLSLEVEFNYCPGQRGSFFQEPVAEEVTVEKVIHRGEDVSALVDIAFLLNLEEEILREIRGRKAEADMEEAFLRHGGLGEAA